MFGSSNYRRPKAERITGHAWENLVSAIDSAGTSARSATNRAKHGAMQLYDESSDRVGDSAKEARRRANLAFDALAGRKPPKPWAALIAATVAGAVIGWFATLFGRRVTAPPRLLTLPDPLVDDDAILRPPARPTPTSLP
ncbi:MAG TPA: hypothetical protein VF163_17295 [Micromonosporaceae bacterium]